MLRMSSFQGCLLALLCGAISSAEQVTIRNADGSTTVLTGHYDQYGNPIITEKYSPPPPEFPVGVAVAATIGAIIIDAIRSNDEKSKADAERQQKESENRIREQEIAARRKLENEKREEEHRIKSKERSDRIKIANHWLNEDSSLMDNNFERVVNGLENDLKSEGGISSEWSQYIEKKKKIRWLTLNNAALSTLILQLGQLRGGSIVEFNSAESNLKGLLSDLRKHSMEPTVNDADQQILEIRRSHDRDVQRARENERRLIAIERERKDDMIKAAFDRVKTSTTVVLWSDWRGVKETVSERKFTNDENVDGYMTALTDRLMSDGDKIASEVLFDIAVAYDAGRLHAKSEGVYVELVGRGVHHAMFNLGRLYANGKIPGKDIHNAIPLWKRAAKYDDKKAIEKLCYLYYEGVGVSRDVGTADSYARRLGYRDALCFSVGY